MAKEYDVVNKPQHYNREGAMESIDEMELIYGTDAVMWFCLLNAHKYRYRAADKNGAEDIAKSDWYMKKFKELKDKKSHAVTTTSYSCGILNCFNNK